ncbi:MAG: glycosyltransferase family 2 protein [Pirellulaceae bacterium]|nr:glycosyltransferase family 2 protein [Pirellulaceae bacterium]
MLDVAVAFVTFNRPEPTRASFARIRSVRPNKLFLVSDAARPDRPGEDQLVQQTRQIAQQVDWDCAVYKIYATSNMGCGLRISSAITQAMQFVDRLIVLEDDCVADPSFFSFCDAMLERYEDDERIMAISGDNFQQGISRTDASYYFSKYMHCWGWATWRRAWEHFSLMIPQWPTFRDAGGLSNWCDSAQEIRYWTEIYDRCHAGESASWAYPWQLSCWMNHGLTILPDVNLVSNIGFGSDATHTQRHDPMTALPTQALTELWHPNHVSRNHDADAYTDRQLFSHPNRVGPLKRLRRKLGITRRAA